MIALRRATVADAERIRTLVRAAYARWVPAMGREPIPMIVDYAKAVEHHIIDLHHVGDDLAALIEMYTAEDHLFIVNLAVAPAFQGRGLGRDLLAHAERVAAAFGLGKIRLFANKVMVENVRLYDRYGYLIDREEPFRCGLVVHMSKPLQVV